jgi:hypothetical protein
MNSLVETSSGHAKRNGKQNTPDGNILRAETCCGIEHVNIIFVLTWWRLQSYIKSWRIAMATFY